MRHLLCLLLLCGAASLCRAQFGEVKLIAHRGGIVDEHTDENSVQAITKAAQQGYYMVELDVRLSKDSVLIVHHDNNLKRIFGVDKNVNELSWKELAAYKSKNGHQIHRLEDLLQLAKKQGLQVMIDFKISGKHPALFVELYELLKKYDLNKKALIIPSEEATDYFRGKIRLSCTRAQVEAYQQRADYSPKHYYLFANPSQEDFDWAKANHIQVVGAINYNARSKMDYQAVAEKLISLGVGYVQLDSQFDPYFKKAN